MASGYDVTIKVYQHYLIERVTHAVDPINVLDVFCSCYTVILATTAKHSSAALPFNHYSTPHPNC